MISFKQFLNENTWKKIEDHNKKLTGDLKTHVDNWTGVSYDSLQKGSTGGVMIPKGLESNADKLHKHGEEIRKHLSKEYGTHVIAYRGISGGKGSTGRQGKLNSYTLNKHVAMKFAGSPGKPLKTIDKKEHEEYAKHLEKHGHVTIGNHTLRKTSHPKYLDIYDKSNNFVTDTTLKDHIQFHNERANEHNTKIENAKKSVIKKKIPIHKISWATDRMNQKEIIVRDK